MRRDVSAREAPSSGNQTETAKPSTNKDEGAVCVRWVRCGRSWCRCMRGGPKHGPYFARYWWRGGRRCKGYVRRQDAERVGAACAIRRESEREERMRADAAHQAWREVRALIREIEHGER